MVVASSSAQSWALFKEQVDDTIIKALQPKIIYPICAKTFPALGGSVEYNVTDYHDHTTARVFGDHVVNCFHDARFKQ